MLKRSKKAVDGMRFGRGAPVEEEPLVRRTPNTAKFARWMLRAGIAVFMVAVGLSAWFTIRHLITPRTVSQTAGRSLGASAFGRAWIDPHFDRSTLDPATYQIPDRIHPRGLNLVFVSDNFGTFDELKQSVANIMNTLKTTEPWKSYDGFNVFLIFNRDDTLCHVDRTNEYAPLLKCAKSLISLVQTLPLVKVKVIVVSRRNFISWANLTRFENSFVFYSVPKEKENDGFNKKIILLELAHGFGMRDETRSVNAVSGEAPARPAPPNCAPTLDVARAWWGDMVHRVNSNTLSFSRVNNDVGFYFGCAGNDSYIRPTQQSLMNIQDFPGAESYGPVSERFLKHVLDYCFSDTQHRVADDPAFFDLYPELKECAAG